MAKVKPENYKEKTDRGLMGLIKVGKNGSEKDVMPCTNIICKAAKSYGRTYIMYIKAYNNEDNAIELQNHNGTLKCEHKIYNIMFGNKCIYALIEKENSEDLKWMLLNKELEIEKEVGDFDVPEYCLEDMIYIKDNKERLEVTDDKDNKFWLELSSGDLTPVTKRHKEKKKQVEPDFYTVEIDDGKKSISMYADNREIRGNSFSNIEEYINKIASLIDLDYDAYEIEEGKEKYIYKIDGVEKQVCNRLFDLIGKLGKNENLEILDYLMQLHQDSKGLELIDKMIEELTNNFAEVSLDKKYGVKVYGFNDELVILIKNELGRVACYKYKVGVNLDEFSMDNIKNMGIIYKYVKRKEVQYTIDILSEHKVEDGDKSKFKLPFSIESNKRDKQKIREYNYGYCKEFKIKLGVNGIEEKIDVKMRVCSDFNYKPKQSKNMKNIVYRARANKVMIEVC